MNFRNILTPASLPGKGWRRNELHLPNLALLVSPVVAQRAECVEAEGKACDEQSDLPVAIALNLLSGKIHPQNA